MRSVVCRLLLAALVVPVAEAAVSAQERVSFRSAATFYGDNTEFSNLFRNGETLFGTAATLALDVEFNDTVTMSGGVFFNHRFGSESFVERVRPVLTVTLQSDHHRFMMGTLDAEARRQDVGIEYTGPHGLLPPLQRENLAFTRPYESGLQWQLTYPTFQHDAWIAWQRLNTVDDRERFDVGAQGRTPVTPNDTRVPISLAYQFHLVHEGGQLYDSGAVRDSWAIGPGVVFEPEVWFFDRVQIDGYAMFSRHVPDRADRRDAGHGHGVFTRFAGEKNGWRGHLIVWGACDWFKDEGDEHYGSRRLDGTPFLNTRHYGEVGLSKIFHPAEGVEVEGSARMHRIEKDYNYSYRILAHVGFDVLMWRR